LAAAASERHALQAAGSNRSALDPGFLPSQRVGIRGAATRLNRIAGTDTHVIRQGESLWVLARRKYDIPIWLLRQYNPDMDFDTVDIGATVTIPQVEPLDEESPVAKTVTATAS